MLLMKPQDLIIPFSWEERKPILLDRLFYIPPFYPEQQRELLPAFSDEKVFGNNKHVHVELCSGNGQWIIEKAQAHPEVNWVAVEMKFERARNIWVRMQNYNINNLFVVFGDARTYMKDYVEKESIFTLYVNFPDPWPKKRHAKHRLVNKAFFDELSLLMHPQGKVILATDDETYAEEMLGAGQSSEGWEPSFPKPYYTFEWPNYGSSFFSNLWQKKGLPIRYLQFEKKAKLGVEYG